MRMYDLIEKKKLGKALTQQEIDWMVQGYTQGEIPDYQMSAFLMAVCFQGMNIEETTAMTLSMAHSGQMSDLSGITLANFRPIETCLFIGGLFLLRKYRVNAIAIIFGTGVVGTLAYSLLGMVA